MAKKVIVHHYASTGILETACGVLKTRVTSVSTRAEVSCGNCRRTARFKQGARGKA